MRRMRATTSGARRGSRGPLERDFRRQKSRNPSRCHRSTVSGLTSSKAWRHRRWRLASSTSRPRSWTRKAGRLTPREATMSCCRRSAFSVTSSARERVRSAMKPLATPEGRHALRSPRIAWAASLATVARSREPRTRNTARSRADPKAIFKLVPRGSCAIVRRRREVATTGLQIVTSASRSNEAMKSLSSQAATSAGAFVCGGIVKPPKQHGYHEPTRARSGPVTGRGRRYPARGQERLTRHTGCVVGSAGFPSSFSGPRSSDPLRGLVVIHATG